MLFALAIALSADALGIGISYGTRKITVPFSAKLVICSVSILITALSMLIGRYLFGFFSPNAAATAGKILLAGMGVWIIFQGVRGGSTEITENKTLLSLFLKPLGITINVIRNPLSCDLNRSSRLDPAEAVYMGVALSVDSFGVGIGSGALGTAALIAPLNVMFLGAAAFPPAQLAAMKAASAVGSAMIVGVNSLSGAYAAWVTATVAPPLIVELSAAMDTV
jgi:putative sporulation protein YtaF